MAMVSRIKLDVQVCLQVAIRWRLRAQLEITCFLLLQSAKINLQGLWLLQSFCFWGM